MVTSFMHNLMIALSGALYLFIVWGDGANSNYPKRIQLAHVPNCIQVTEGVYSGGLPEGSKGFDELQRLGVKTLISVDGMKPDIQTAKKFQLRYVHLPHGYEGISNGRLLELTKALHSLPKPVYIHCHHGKHRSPAATAAACVSLGWIDHSSASRVLEVAGTNPNYRGLISAVTNASAITPIDLDKVQVKFQEIAPLPPLVETMVSMDEHMEAIAKLDSSLAQDRDQRTAVADRVLLLTDHYTELHRTSEAQKTPMEYQHYLAEGESICVELESCLRNSDAPVTPRDAKPLVERLKSNCTSCHKLFRDNRTPENPQPSKKP